VFVPELVESSPQTSKLETENLALVAHTNEYCVIIAPIILNIEKQKILGLNNSRPLVRTSKGPYP
jgi:hypothetical protein